MMSRGTVEALSPYTVSPSDTIRWKAWGAASDAPAGRYSDVDSNTDVIALDSDVRRLMPSDDVRSKYFLVGSTWTTNGAGPSARYPGGSAAGTDYLAHTTLETYQQGDDTTSSGSFSCFDCHNAASTDLIHMSHIFAYVKPLVGKPLNATPHAVTLKLAKSGSEVYWNTQPPTLCGNAISAADYFQVADRMMGPAFTSFLPFLTSVAANQGSSSAPNVMVGSESWFLTSMNPYGSVLQQCNDVSAAPSFASALVDARAGALFDMRPVLKKTIVSATLILEASRTVVVTNKGELIGNPCYNASVNAVPPGVVCRDFPGRYVTIPYGYASDIRGGWCPVEVAVAEYPWWPDYWTRLGAYRGIIGSALRPATQGASYADQRAKNLPSASIDVTKAVSEWVDRGDRHDFGFVITPAHWPTASVSADQGCLTQYVASLKVVYFD